MNNFPWLLFGFYANTDYREQRVLWHEISNLLGQGIFILVVGDFDCMESSQEKRGGKAFIDGVESRKFQGFIERNGLVNLEFVGPRLSWCNNHHGEVIVYKSIDRAFVGVDWIRMHLSYRMLEKYLDSIHWKKPRTRLVRRSQAKPGPKRSHPRPMSGHAPVHGPARNPCTALLFLCHGVLCTTRSIVMLCGP